MPRVLVRAVTTITILCITITAQAAGTAEDAIKYRNHVMTAMAAHMGSLMLILFNKVDSTDYAQSHADAIANASAELAVLFPENSRDGDTDALAVIWDNPDAFGEAISKTQSASNNLQTAIQGGDRKAIIGAAAAVGKACKGCHEQYRAEDHDDGDSH
jgi:cytochrome c556